MEPRSLLGSVPLPAPSPDGLSLHYKVRSYRQTTPSQWLYGTLVGVAEGRDLYPWVHVMTRLNRVAVDGVCVMVEVVKVVEVVVAV